MDRVLDTPVPNGMVWNMVYDPDARQGTVAPITHHALFGIPKVIAYSAAKSAYLGMVRSLATEISPHGIRVNAIAPGWIESEIQRAALVGDADRSRKILERTPINRFGTPEDVGWAATYLCSPAARSLTGVVLLVEGGVSIGF